MAITESGAIHVMSENEYCRLHKIPCKSCGQLFKASEGVTKMWDLFHVGGQRWVFHHYPACPPIPEVAPSSNPAVSRTNYNVDEGWE